MQGVEISKRDRELGIFEKISNNCARISGSMYLVKNQSGFNNALYNYTRVMRGCDWYSRKEIRSMVNNYPVKYPCLIALSDDFFERNIIFNPKVKYVGIASGILSSEKICTIINFCEEYYYLSEVSL